MANNRARRTSNLWTHSLETLTLIAWLSVWTRRTAAQEVVNATVGGTVTLTAPVTTGIGAFTWYKGTAASETQVIITYFGSAQTSGPQSTGRESGSPDGTLHIRDVQTSDAGNYTVTVTLSNATTRTATRQLRVYESDPNAASNSGLSGGAIAGIVIAAVVVLTGVGVLVYIFVFKKPASGAAAAGDSTEMAPKSKEASASPKANGATPEIQYSSVNFVPKRATPAKPIAPENTVYSEVRR